MSTKWLTSKAEELPALLSRLKEEHDDIAFIEAVAIVDHTGAFVEITSRHDAEQLFLADTVVIHSGRLEPSYEPCLTREFRHACFVTSESKTADIEQVLVSGVHGPRECIFLVVQ
jgi:hypothetical protein